MDIRSTSADDDYMSDIFVQQTTANDIRPGLLGSFSKKRQHEVEKKKKASDAKHKKVSEIVKLVENERRNEGLTLAIDSSNKGFSMLTKMGFSPGTGIGKNQTGITEPIPIVIKNDRQGLGRSEALKQLKLQKLKIIQKRKEKNKPISVEEFRSNLSKKSREKEIEVDLRKSQKACENLDVKNDITVPAEKWFWFTQEEVKDSEDDEESEDAEMECDFDLADKLSMITLYLRQTYGYCIWCGTQFEDELDLQQNCPGDCRDDH